MTDESQDQVRKPALPVRLAAVLAVLTVLGALLSQATPWSTLAPPGHSSERCSNGACHSPPADGNEEGDIDEGKGPDGDISTSGSELPRLQAVGTGWIDGYASSTSVPQGGSIDFHTSAGPGVTTYDLVIFRPGAHGPEPILTIADLPGQTYTCRAVAARAGQEGLDLGCDWPVAYTLNVPADWPSGLYVAAMLDADDVLRFDRYASYIPFIVKEDQPGSTADILFQFSTATWQAYNNYGGWSLYTDPRAHLITFDRPYANCMIGDAATPDCMFKWDLPLASWLESEGYAVEYMGSEDLHADPTLLRNYTLFISAGHDEYLSKEMRDNIDAFIDAGGNMAVFSGNTCFRQIRFQEENRTLICYKYADRMLDPLYGVDNRRVASRFDSDPIFWPQNSTIGLGFARGGYVNTGDPTLLGQYTVYRSDHWVYRDTGLRDGDKFWYELGRRVEVDGAEFIWQDGLPVATGTDDTPASLIILGLQKSTAGHATMAIYTRDGGGTVFNAATMGWGRGLWPSNNPDDYEIVRQITRNVIDTLSVADGPHDWPPIVDFSAATYSVSEGASSATVWVELGWPSSSSVTVEYATSDGTATADLDYHVTNGTLTFDPGVTRLSFDVSLIADALDEADETVVLTLSDPSNATLGNDNPAMLIIEDDDDPPTVDFSDTAYRVAEGAGTSTITVALDAPSGRTVEVNYATSDGTARAPGDYTGVTGTLTFGPGDTSQTFEVPIVDDVLKEGDETVVLTLSGASYATIGSANPATLTILDDENMLYLPVIRS